jgi:uncharacterized protein
VTQIADSFELATLDLRPGDGRRLDLGVRVRPIDLGGQRYGLAGDRMDARLDVSRPVSGYALRLRFDAHLSGACMRCLEQAEPVISVDAREIDQPGGGEELHSPYVEEDLVDLSGWARDALLLALPAQLLCRPDCKGLCAVCGVNLNDADPAAHEHERGGDPRWAKLRELKLD